MSVFAQFTNKYALSKTLRFELKPVGNTQKMLEDNNVFAKDEARKIAYTEIKPYIDRLHREFIEESLIDFKLTNLEDYKSEFEQYKKDKKNTDQQKNMKKFNNNFEIKS